MISKDDLLQIKDSYAEDTRHFVRFLEENRLELDAEGLRQYVEYRSRQHAYTTLPKIPSITQPSA